MRLWSIHPKYLDSKGLVALWRESLLAKHVLEGKTSGYRYHPQLDKMKKTVSPIDAINQYLVPVYDDAVKRGFNFDKGKINFDFRPIKLTVNKGQLDFEVRHLMNKLKIRSPQKYIELKRLKGFEVHPLFELVEGGIENWEK